jgi:hypothetical protein
MTIKKIVLVGDSWGCGEWDNTAFAAPCHPGLTEYLSDQYVVKNLSRSGNSLWQICYTLESFLDRIGDEKETAYVVIQTDAMREQNCQDFDVNYMESCQTANSLLMVYQMLLEKFYFKLQNIGDRYNITIHLIGGLCDVFTEGVAGLNRINVLCSSWVSLIDQAIGSGTPMSLANNVIPVHLRPESLSQLKTFKKLFLIDEAINHTDATFLFNQRLIESKYFGPIHGDFHPSREGHLLLANHIKSTFERIK